jgi:hypothetical protein
MTDYKTTFVECQKLIGNDNVCEGCGGKIEPIETVDNSGAPTFWVGCKHCMCFRSGVRKLYWKIARKLVVEGRILPYSSLHKCEYEDTPERLGYYLDSQTAGLSNDIAYIHKLIKGG